MLDRAKVEPRHCRRLRLLAAACLDTAQVVHPEITHRIEAALGELVPPRSQQETRSLALAGNRVLRRLPAALDGLSDASAAACVKTAAWVGGPEAQRLLTRWSPDPRGAVQRAFAQVWRYFDPSDYAEAVLRDAPLDNGKITVERFEHVSHLCKLRNLYDASIELINVGKADDLSFLRDVPPVVTSLTVEANGPVDLTPLTELPTLKSAQLLGGEARAGWEAPPALSALYWLSANPPHGGRDMSFFSILAECPSLTHLHMDRCTDLSDLSTLASISRLRHVGIRSAYCLHNLRILTRLPNLQYLYIDGAPLRGGLAAVAPVLDRLKTLGVWSVPTVMSLDGLTGSSLRTINLANFPAISLEPLATVQSLGWIWLRQFPAVHLDPLAGLPHLQKLNLIDIEEPVDLSPLAQIDHRIRIELRNTSTAGTAGPLVKVQQI